MRAMKNRLTERDEKMYLNMSFEEDKPEFLRRKSAQGRNSQSQDE
jgi:Ca-activated chloride channel family protein